MIRKPCAFMVAVTILLMFFFLTISEGAIGQWIRKTDMPTPRMVLKVCAVNGKIYAIGGDAGDAALRLTLDVVEEYDPGQDVWTKRSKMPSKRQSFAVVTFDNKIYIIGGWRAPGDFPSEIYVYDPKKDEWTEKGTMQFPRSELGACAIGNKIYVIGGGRGIGNVNGLVEEYDPEKDTWTRKSNMPNPR